MAASPAISEASHTSIRVRFDDPISGTVSHSDLDSYFRKARVVRGAAGEPALPWVTSVAPTSWPNSSGYVLAVVRADTIAVNGAIPALEPDSHTDGSPASGAFTPYRAGIDDWYPGSPVLASESGDAGMKSVTSLTWCPFRYNPNQGILIVIREGVISLLDSISGNPSNEPIDETPADEDLDRLLTTGLNERSIDPPLPSPSPDALTPPSWTPPTDPPLGIQYVVVTSAGFKDALLPLVRWKAERGINAGLATVEAVTAQYPGADAAASIREYLKAAYAAGLQYVLLAGDETVVPVRHAYAGYQSQPSDPYNFHICDLYYAELNGNWDADGDGIYGEYFGDQAELYAELFVGRLPFSDQSEAAIIVNKIMAYERGPQDASYLSRALSLSTDQMRDWDGGVGQQIAVGASMPGGWQHDGQSMLEQPSGESPTPYAPEPTSLPQLIASGFGWVNYLVHGRADGVIVRAPGYTNIPQSYVWTFGTSGDGHGHLNEMPPHKFSGIHLSIGCDHGGFDMDTPPFNPGYHESVSERLLFTPDGGAVAFVGNSRWGWVATSYKLIQRFYELLNDPGIPNHLGVYQSLAKVAFPSYRDLNYSNNLYGDPETPAWKTVPNEWSVTGPTTFGGYDDAWAIEANGPNGPVEGAIATVNIGDSVWVIGTTNAGGRVAATLNLPAAWDAVLTVWKEGFRAYVDTVPYTIITDVKDGDNETGGSLPVAGLMNYPNPFNPSTVLRYSVAQPGDVHLEVFDVLGRRVVELLNEPRDAGSFTIEFDGRDQQGRPLASGMYFARLRTRTSTTTRAMVLLR